MAILDDFRSVTIHAGGHKEVKKLISQDKGQRLEVKAFIDSILLGRIPSINFDELYSTSLVTFRIIESLRSKQALRI